MVTAKNERFLDDDGRFWVVVHTKIGREDDVARGLEEQGYGAFLPLCYVESRSRRPLRLMTPLFPRYLFAGVTREQRVTPIRYTPGVADVLMAAGDEAPATVPAGVIEAIRARIERDGGAAVRLDEGRPPEQWPRDAAVRVVSGPMIGYDGYFQRASGDRITLMLDTARGLVPMSLPGDCVRRL